MPDSRITALPLLTTITDTDIFPVVDDPSGTPVTKRVSALTLKNFVQSLLGSTGVLSYANPVLASSTFGVSPTAATAINTKSVYTELVAATTASVNRLLVCVSGTGTATGAAATGLIDIAVGASGSESVIIPDLPYDASTNETWIPYGYALPFAVNIPASSRIAMRYQATATASGARPNVIVIGFG